MGKKKENSQRGGIRAGLSFLKFPTDVLRISVSGIMRGGGFERMLNCLAKLCGYKSEWELSENDCRL